MKSYFFVPASRLRKLDDIKKSSPDSIIIDFEDAILSEDIDLFFEELKSMPDVISNWFRIPVRNNFNENLNLEYIKKFKSIGVKRMILPKLIAASELIEITERFKDLKFIILIEHPRLLIELRQVLMQKPAILKTLVGIGIGSHDLMTFLNAKHTAEQLDYPRKEVLYLSKAYNLEAIDIASMDIFNNEEFVKEVIYGQENGFDAKFLIHPNQLIWLKGELESNITSLVWAQKILVHLPSNYKGEDIAPFVLDGAVIEKPHALKALEIVKKHNYGK